MNRTEVLQLIANQENSRVEFKRDDIHPDQLTKEMSALLNLEGSCPKTLNALIALRKSAEKVA